MTLQQYRQAKSDLVAEVIMQRQQQTRVPLGADREDVLESLTEPWHQALLRDDLKDGWCGAVMRTRELAEQRHGTRRTRELCPLRP